MNVSSQSFEQLLMNQSETLINSDPKDFTATWSTASFDVLDWFDIDRLTLYPNSMVLLEDGKTISVSKSHIPPIDKQDFLGCNHLEYLKLLKTQETYLEFSGDQLAKIQNDVLRRIYKQGGKWHCIIPLQLFNQRWGALSFTNFHDNKTTLGLEDIKRLKLVCEMWLCYWQHSTLARTLNQSENLWEDDSDKLLLLSKKQTKVLSLIAQGYTAKECADKLHLSPRTIESHKYRMLGLMNLNNHNELVQFALRNGLGITENRDATR
ncbi:LuxR C-terminal-related transcriptional regulator [Vibrio chagasii]|nr:LuxR C-terminal-related transcriptional regulator [Vibrio chagasii]MCY9825734.1 LuxR C-terminal-related transcriptional regulator [Vibrio chagasii]